MSWILLFDEELENPIPRVIKDRLNPIENLNETECIQRFRFDKNGIIDLCQLLESDLRRPTLRSNSLPVLVQVCAALRFFAQGAFYRVTGKPVVTV